MDVSLRIIEKLSMDNLTTLLWITVTLTTQTIRYFGSSSANELFQHGNQMHCAQFLCDRMLNRTNQHKAK